MRRGSLSNHRLKNIRREQKEGFALGFFGGGGIFSVLILLVYNLFRGPKSREKESKDGKGPESFEL